jgi:hypothetical protein
MVTLSSSPTRAISALSPSCWDSTPWSRQLAPALNGIITQFHGQILSTAPTTPVFSQGMGTDITPTGEYWQQTLEWLNRVGGVSRRSGQQRRQFVRHRYHR